MSREEKILLITNGVFTVASLILLLYMPKTAAFDMPDLLKIVLYIPPAVCFFIYVKIRTRIKISLKITWINCAYFIFVIILFAIANWYSPHSL